MLLKLFNVLLPIPASIFQNYLMKSTSTSNGIILITKKKTLFTKKKVLHSENLLNKELFGPVQESIAIKNTKKTKLNKKVAIDNQKTKLDKKCATDKTKKTKLNKKVAIDNQKTKLDKKCTTDNHVEHEDIKHQSLTLAEFGNPVFKDDINQMKDNSSPVNNKENVHYKQLQNQPSSNFLLFNEKKCNNIYPQSDIININYDGEYTNLPSVTKILQDTMPPERKLILKKWEENMIKKLGEEGFRNYKQDMFDRGKLFHSYIEQSLRNQIEDDFQNITQFIKSVKNVLENISNIMLLESRVVHPHLQYHGYVDCVGFYRDDPVVIEFKTSTKPKSDLSLAHDSPLQAVAYLGALNFDPSYDTMPNITNALLVIAYESGVPAHVLPIKKEKCHDYWQLWQKRLCDFKNVNGLAA